MPTPGLSRMPSRSRFSPMVHARRGSAMKGCLIAAAIAFVLIVVAVVGGGWYVSKNWRGWTANVMESGLNDAIDETPMADSEKAETKAVITGLMEDFRQERINPEDFFRIIEQLETSPLLPAALAQGSYMEYYRDRDDLTDEQKASAELALDRLTRGLFEETISGYEFEGVLQPIRATSVTQNAMEVQVGNIDIRIKQADDCTPEELMEVVANAETLLDEKGVPSEPYQIDVSAELERVINTALGREVEAQADAIDAAVEEAEAGEDVGGEDAVPGEETGGEDDGG